MLSLQGVGLDGVRVFNLGILSCAASGQGFSIAGLGRHG